MPWKLMSEVKPSTSADSWRLLNNKAKKMHPVLNKYITVILKSESFAENHGFPSGTHGIPSTVKVHSMR